MRYNAALNNLITVAPGISRQNGNLTAPLRHTDDLTVYGRSSTIPRRLARPDHPATALVPIVCPARLLQSAGTDNHRRPGQPHRLSNLTGVPASGLPVTFATYRFNDFGPDHVDVDSYQTASFWVPKGRLWARLGRRAALWEAQAIDGSDGVDSTALANSLALSTPDAYNPFNGGCLPNSAGQVVVGATAAPSSPACDQCDAKTAGLSAWISPRLPMLISKCRGPTCSRCRPVMSASRWGVEFRDETHSEQARSPHQMARSPSTDPV